MVEEWLRPVEQVMLSSEVRHARVIGVVALDAGAGVSTLCRTAAELSERSGLRTLLIDLSAPIAESGGEALWSDTSRSQFGFDTAFSTGGRSNTFRFSRNGWFREVLTEQFAGYDRIVVDLPPLLSPLADGINPTAAAAACDAVILLIMRGASSPSQVEDAAELLRSAGGNLAGAVLNDFAPRRRSA